GCDGFPVARQGEDEAGGDGSGFPQPVRERGFLRGREEAERDFADGGSKSASGDPGRDGLRVGHRCAARGGQRGECAEGEGPRDGADHALPAPARVRGAGFRARDRQRSNRQVGRSGPGAGAGAQRVRLDRAAAGGAAGGGRAIVRDARESFLSSFAHLEARLRQTGGEGLHRLRRSGIERFAELGLPTPKHEEWKYTQLSSLAATPFEVAGPNGVSAQTVAQVCAGFVGIRLVFLNGQFDKHLSSIGCLPSGTVVCGLKAAAQDAATLLDQHLGRHLPTSSAFAALNSAFIEDGALVYLPRGTILHTPVYLVFVSSAPGKPTMSHPRNLIIAGAGCEATV